MATQFSTQLQPSNSTDALFRAWCTFVRDGLLGGWTQTADTGQMNFATITRPLAADTVQGYALFAMADALQGAAPIVVKLEFGSGTAANEPDIRLTIGSGSNGSGTITGVLTSRRINNSSNSAVLTSVFSHSSVSASHFAVSLFVHANAAYLLSFSLERARDSTGAETATSVILIDGGTQGPVTYITVIALSGTTNTNTSFVSIVVPTVVNAGAHSEYVAQQDISFGLILPVNLDLRPEPAILGYVLTPDTFTTTDATLVVYIYSRPHVYKRLNNVRPGIGSNGNVNSHVVWQRYE